MIYFHGAGSAGNFFETAAVFRPLRDYLLDAGIVIIEAVGGAASDMASEGGKQNWGNETSRVAYMLGFQWADAIHHFSSVALLGRSMGGMNGYYFGTRHPTIASRVSSIIINSGVSNLIAANNVPEGGNPDYATGLPSGAGKFWPTMWTAHDAADATEFATAVSPEYDPHQFSASVFAGKRIMQLVGTADNTVPKDAHGLAMRTLYAGQPAADELIVGEGKTHSSTNGMYDYPDEMFAFIAAGLPDPPDPPAPADTNVYQRVRSYYFDGAASYLLTHNA
jgi:pimeloyl-ACP methyl ester carboxylesterase